MSDFNNKKVSIIIPLPKINKYILEAIPYYENLEYKNFEIIILPDEEENIKLSDKLDIKIIKSGKVGPAEKRDLGAKYASGEILAFTDDDAFPDKYWLTNALKLFDDANVAAVGGPAITPDNDSFWQKVSGSVYASLLMSGSYRKRYVRVGLIHEDYDLPSVNLIVRKEIFLKIGGFDSTFYPGEDTKLCLEIKKLNYKILYNPDSFVYHHRRNLFPNHFQQIANYALHRGYFVKKYPETSRIPFYFIPSLFLIGLILGFIISFFSYHLRIIYLSVLILYFILNLIFSFNKNPLLYFWTIVGTFLSHIVYGYYFIIGLFFTKYLHR